MLDHPKRFGPSEHAALVALVTAQIRTQEYRWTYDRKVDITLNIDQATLLLKMLGAALRGAPDA